MKLGFVYVAVFVMSLYLMACGSPTANVSNQFSGYWWESASSGGDALQLTISEDGTAIYRILHSAESKFMEREYRKRELPPYTDYSGRWRSVEGGIEIYVDELSAIAAQGTAPNTPVSASLEDADHLTVRAGRATFRFTRLKPN